MDELEKKLIQIIVDWYGNPKDTAKDCLEDLFEEMQQHDANTVLGLITK